MDSVVSGQVLGEALGTAEEDGCEGPGSGA